MKALALEDNDTSYDTNSMDDQMTSSPTHEKHPERSTQCTNGNGVNTSSSEQKPKTCRSAPLLSECEGKELLKKPVSKTPTDIKNSSSTGNVKEGRNAVIHNHKSFCFIASHSLL